MRCGDRPPRLGKFSSHLLGRCRRGLLVVLASGLLRVAAAADSSASCSGSGSCLSAADCVGVDGLVDGKPAGAWYCAQWEHDHLEAWSAAAMLLVAIAFENIYHHLEHQAEHSFVYGQAMMGEEEKHAHADRTLFTKPLRLILFNRMGGEFMVLGFLAFTIWTFNQQNIFAELADISGSSVHLPTAGSTYLHLLEEVHMQLFVAMILYFALCFVIISAADDRIRDFERCRSAWVEQLLACDGSAANNNPGDDKNLRAFKFWRAHFLDGAVKEIEKWQHVEQHQHSFQEIMHSMKMDKELGTVTMADLKEVFTGRFSFCSYVVFSLCNTTTFVVAMSVKTMLSIIVIKSIFAILHRFAHIQLIHISFFLSCMCFVFLLLVYYVTAIFKESLAHETVKVMRGLSWLPEAVDRMSHSFDPGRFMLTIMQVFLFFLCHAWAGNLISSTFWAGVFGQGEEQEFKILITAAYSIALVTLANVLRKIVPDFAIVQALPPFFSYHNQNMIKLVAVQVVDAKMVAAREALKAKLEEKKRLEELAKKAAEADGDLEPKDVTSSASSSMPPKDKESPEPSDGTNSESQPFVNKFDENAPKTSLVLPKGNAKKKLKSTMMKKPTENKGVKGKQEESCSSKESA